MGQPESLGLSQGETAWIDGAFLVAYAFGQFVWGMGGDRLGTRRVILVGMLGSVLAALAMGMAAPASLPGWVASVLQSLANPIGVSVMTLLLGALFFVQGWF